MPPLAFWLGLAGAWAAIAAITVGVLARATRTAADDPTDTLAEQHPWDRDLDDLIRESTD